MSDTCSTCRGTGCRTTGHPYGAIKVLYHVPCPDCQPDRDYDKHVPAENPTDKPLHNQPPETLGEVGNEGAGRFHLKPGSDFGPFVTIINGRIDAAHAAGIAEGEMRATEMVASQLKQLVKEHGERVGDEAGLWIEWTHLQDLRDSLNPKEQGDDRAS